MPPNPIWIGREHRSGTTLLSVLLDSHPDLVVGSEIDFTGPVNLGPLILAVCDVMNLREAQLVGTTKETVDPEWYGSIRFVVLCKRLDLGRDEVRQLVKWVMA